MSQDMRYARGAEDAQECIAREIERAAENAPSYAEILTALAALARSFSPETIRKLMEADASWMRTVAGREVERVRAGWRARSKTHYYRNSQKAGRR